MDVSVVIPFLDEEESLPELYQQLTDVLASTKWSYELIFVDDGSQDKGWEFVRSTAKNDASVRAVKFTRNFGKSQALHVGFDLAKGMLSLPWMRICKTVLKNYQQFTSC